MGQNEGVMPEEITVSYVCHHYPKKLMDYLQKNQRVEIVNVESGIYYLLGEAMQVQIIVSRMLDKKKNFWLRCLTNKLEGEEAQELLTEYSKYRNSDLYSSIAGIIISANEELFGGKSMRTPEEILERLWADRIEEKLRALEQEAVQRVEQKAAEERAQAAQAARQEAVQEATRAAVQAVTKVLQALNVPEEEWEKYREMVNIS